MTSHHKVRVYVATTNGPSEVQRLAEEDPDVASVVCLNGTSQALPISAAYDAFVRKPTGVIEKTIGHGVFRADVAEAITDGQSWQLGFFLAHSLKHQGLLAEKGEHADRVIWASGEVNHDLSVSPIAHMDDKLQASQVLFAELRSQGLAVDFVLHPDNAAELPSELQFMATAITSVAEIVDLGNEPGPEAAIPEPKAAAASYTPTTEASDDPEEEPPISQPWRFVGMGIAVLLMFSLAFPFWRDLLINPDEIEYPTPEPAAPMFHQPTETQEDNNSAPVTETIRPVPQTGGPMDLEGSNPVFGPLRLAAFQRRAPEGQICSDTVRGERTEIIMDARGFRTDAGRDLCRLFIKADNVADEPRAMLMELAPAIQRVGGERENEFKRELRLAEVVKPGDAIGMGLHRFWSLQRPGRLSVTVMSLPAYSPLLERWSQAGSEDRAEVMANIRSEGGHVLVEKLRLGRPKNRAAERFQ